MQTKKLSFSTRVLILIVIFATLFFNGGININPLQDGEVAAQTIHPCLNRVNIPFDQLHWLYVPESADQLYTEEQYFFLAGQLIANNVVDAEICPSGGLMHNGYANACGMATALPKVVTVQNMMDQAILQAWLEVGVPPVLLKQLIRRESQFWPATYQVSEMDLIEFGFGHITYIGMQNALQWNRNLYAKVCASSDDVNCVTDSGVVNQFLFSLINTCENCEYGIDPLSVQYSVDILAETLLGHCYQTSQLVYNATGWYTNLVVDYPTLWKLTLMDFTSGPNCVYDTVLATFDETEGPMSWAEISSNVEEGNCEYGLNYANQITAKYYNFPPSQP